MQSPASVVDVCAEVLLNSTCLHADEDMDAMRDLLVELTHLDDPARATRCQVCPPPRLRV